MSDHPEDGVPPVDADATRPQPESQPSVPHNRTLRLLQIVGEGGMGEVWLAEQTHPVRRQVALKVIKAGMDTAQVVSRFEAERQALALMDHRPSPPCTTAAAHRKAARIRHGVREGRADHELLRPRKADDQGPPRIVHAGMRGRAARPQKGIIHRDLKPSNVLVTIQDDHPVPKIIDFGVAKATAQHLTERTLYTELGVMIGTPEYMSPEQAEMGGLDIDTPHGRLRTWRDPL